MTSPDLDDDHVAVICRVLVAHDVEFVFIGGVAARLHDTGYATVDIDICPARGGDNLTCFRPHSQSWVHDSASKGTPKGSRSIPIQDCSPT